MTQRTSPLILVALTALSLCGCAAAGDTDSSATPDGGSIELAVSETCAAGSDPQCIPVDNEHVMSPSGFETADVRDAVASDDQKTVDVTLTDTGAQLLNDLTTRASEAGTESRLLVKVGDEIVSAVAVMEPLRGDHVTFGVAPDDDPDAVVELIQGN